MAGLFQDTNYRDCFRKYNYDLIIKILGKPYTEVPNNHAYFFIEKPRIDSSGMVISIRIGFDGQGFINRISKGNRESVDYFKN